MIGTLWLGLCLVGQAPVPLGTFEGEQERWVFSNGPEFPGARGALRRSQEAAWEGEWGAELRYDFTQGGAYVAAYVDFPPLEISHFTLWVKKPREGTLTFRVTDSTGQTFQKSLRYAYGGWQKVRVNLGGWSLHWGGANDGRLHPPLKRFGLLIEKRGLANLQGTLFFDEVMAYPGPAQEEPGMIQSTYLVSDFGTASGWSAGGAGRLEAGRWHYDFQGPETSAWLSHSLSLLGRPLALRFKARGGVAGHRLRIRLGSHFQIFERELGSLTGGEVSFSVPAPPEGWKFFGGENDGRVRHPLRVVQLILERGDGPEGKGTLEALELEATTEVPQDRAITLVAAPGQRESPFRLAFRCVGWNLLPEPLSGRLRMQVEDWEGRVLAEVENGWVLPAQGSAEQKFSVSVPEGLTFAEARFLLLASGQEPTLATATFTAPLATLGSPELEPASPWGMGLYLYRYPNTPEGLADLERAAALAQAAGVKWSREEFQWGRIEPQRGKFEWDFYDKMVDIAQRHGISIYGLLAYWSPWTKPYTEEGIEDFCRWAREVVRRFKGRIRHWEVYNEPNIFFWQGPKELYPVLLRRAYEAIKEEDPQAQVLGCSTAGIDQRFIQMCLEAGAPFDVLTIHPYREQLEEGGFLQELRQVAALVGGRPVWITEMGWATHVGGVSEREQARQLARCYLTAVASGACSNISWYDFRDDGTDPFYNEHNFGVVRRDFSPKPAYRALATLARLLPQAREAGQVEMGEGVWCFRYATALGPAYALWTGETRCLALRLRGPAPTAVNLMGESLPLPPSPQEAWLVLPARTPLLLRGVEEVESLGEPLALSSPEGVRAGQQFILSLRCQRSRAEGLRWRWALPPGWEGPAEGLLEMEEGSGVSWTLRPPFEAAPGVHRLPLLLHWGEGERVWPLEVEVLPSEVSV